MNGLIKWFDSKSKLKRWMFLILIGVILMCYGTAEILVLKEMSFSELAKIIVTFVIGVVAIVLGLIFLNKRTLEILIEYTDDRMNDKNNVNIQSLIFNKKVYHQGPNIVVIGGGTGLNTVLSGLKNYTNNITQHIVLVNSRNTIYRYLRGDYTAYGLLCGTIASIKPYRRSTAVGDIGLLL